MTRTTQCPTCRHKNAPHKEGHFLAHSKPGRQAGILCRATGTQTPQRIKRMKRLEAQQPRQQWPTILA